MGRGSIILMTLLMSLLWQGRAQASGAPCLQKKPFQSRVVINLEVPEPYYDLTQTKAYLNNDGGRSKREWLAKNNMTGIWSAEHMTTMGIAQGGWAVNYSWQLDPEPLDQYWAYACLYVRDMEINMIYRTMIMIPKEYPREGCDFEVIHNHELRHYKVNRMVALKTAKKLEDDMPLILRTLEGHHIGSDRINDRVQEIKTSIRELVDVYFKQVMAAEMRRLNGQIDTPEEYSSHKKEVAACEERRRNAQNVAKSPAAPYINRAAGNSP